MSSNLSKVRRSTVDGFFYPQKKDELLNKITSFFNNISTTFCEKTSIKGLISPHAGYEYSGLTAAYGYKALKYTNFKTAIILAPSHFASFYGAALTDAQYYETPLGLVPINQSKVETLLQNSLFKVNPSSQIMHPSWAQYTLIKKDIGEENAHTWEHSLEVQLPFLQYINPNVDIVPILLSHVEPNNIAEALLKILDKETIIIASSDLSHYHHQNEAKVLDKSCIDAILGFRFANILTHEACGIYPIATLMHIASKLNWKPTLLDYRDSSYASGDKHAVVGYASIVYYES